MPVTGSDGKGLNQVTVITTPFTVDREDILLVDPGVPGTDITINLPPSADRVGGECEGVHPVAVMNKHSNNTIRVNIFPDGSEEINEVLTIQLKRKESVVLSPDGSDWWIISS